MKVTESFVTARDGSNETVKARVVTCERCDCQFFNLYYIGEDDKNLHLQCQECETSYCSHEGPCRVHGTQGTPDV